MTLIPHPIASAARARPQHIAIHIDGSAITYHELLQRVQRRAGALAAAGLRPAQTVILSKPRSLDWIIDAFAIGWCGASAALVPVSLSAAERSARCETIEVDWILGIDDRSVGEQLSPGDFIQTVEEPLWTLDSTRYILWTSGSTGQPKPVPITTSQWILSAFGSAIRLEHRLDDCWLACLPFEHIGGLSILLRCFLYGTTIDVHSNFDLSAVNRALQGGRISQVSLVPAMLKQLLNHRSAGPLSPEVRVVLLGGAATDDALIERCHAESIPIALTWGMTEAASQVCTTFVGTELERGLVGPPLAFSRVGVDKGRLTVDGGTVGETQHTSDLGEITDDGQVRVLGRIDDVINSGGKKISAAEVENVLGGHPSIEELAILGRVDERWGQRPVAFVTLSDPNIASRDLEDWLMAQMSKHKVPRSWVYCDQLPRTSVGKIDRRRLLDRLTRFVEQPDGFEGHLKFLSSSGGGHLCDADEGVLEMNDGSDVPLSPDNLVAESDRSLTHAFDSQSDRELVAVSDHSLEGGFGMHQGESDPLGVITTVDAPESGGEHIFKANMSVLKDPIKKENTRPIDFVETGGNRNIERHNRDLSPKDT
jgi:o-succinylbenzoate---CoA ligase